MLISISSSIPCTCLDYFEFDRDRDTFLLCLWTRKNFQRPLGRWLGVFSCRLIAGPTKEYIPTKTVSHFFLLCMIGLSVLKQIITVLKFDVPGRSPEVRWKSAGSPPEVRRKSAGSSPKNRRKFAGSPPEVRLTSKNSTKILPFVLVLKMQMHLTLFSFFHIHRNIHLYNN